MDAGPARQGEVTNLLDHEAKLIADMLQHYRAIALSATVRVSNRSTVGEAAANRLRMETEATGLIQTAEDLLSLTRRIRELWIIGPLRKPGEGDAEAETRIRNEVVPVAQLLDTEHVARRQRLMGPHGTYKASAAPATAVAAAAAAAAASAAAPAQPPAAAGTAQPSVPTPAQAGAP